MHPVLFHLGKITIYSYGLMIALGIVACVLVAERRERRAGMQEGIIYNVALFGVIGGFLCAKILYWITILPEIIADPSILLDFANGFVVFGGLIGGVGAAWLYCRLTKRKFMPYLDLAAPSIALAQGFGRIGCFLAGCCYGDTCETFPGLYFNNSSFAPHDVRIFPIQLVSSALNFLNFLVLSYIWKKKPGKPGFTGSMYIINYSVGRFILEFFRGDIERGTVGILSTSQFIAIFTCAAGILLMAVTQRKAQQEETS